MDGTFAKLHVFVCDYFGSFGANLSAQNPLPVARLFPIQSQKVSGHLLKVCLLKKRL